MLAKVLKFSTLKCIVQKIIKRSFKGCNVGFKGKGEEVDKWFGNVELKVIKSMEQATLYQSKIKKYKNSNPNWNIPTN